MDELLIKLKNKNDQYTEINLICIYQIIFGLSISGYNQLNINLLINIIKLIFKKILCSIRFVVILL